MEKTSQHDRRKHAEAGFFSREAVGSVPWVILGKAVLFFVYFGISMLTVNGLGKEQYGIYSLMTNISAYMVVLCSLGLGAALMRYVPELTARKNRRGLLFLMWKSAVLQLAAVVGVSAVLLYFSGPLQQLFQAGHVEHFRFYLMLACGLALLLLLKDFVGTVFTSIYKTRTAAILSVVYGSVWLLMLYVWLYYKPAIGSVFFVQMLSIGLIYSLGAVLLFKYVYGLTWTNNEFGIGKKRTLAFSATVMLSTLLRMVMFKYSEIFFVAAVMGATAAGVYDLGYTLPYTVITFIPLALLPVFTSAFAEAFVRDPGCLGRLIRSYYKVLMLASMPIGILGAFFAPDAYRILYRGQMEEAGHLASAFCMVLLLPLISMPLSAAIKAKEKVLQMVPMLILQLVVNLYLDWLFIVYFKLGTWGGIYAVAGTFLLTIPFRLAVIQKVLGGIYFPAGFFFRIGSVLAVLSFLLKQLTDSVGLFHLFTYQWINIGLLFATGGLFLVLFVLCIRYLGLIRREDVEEFQALDIRKLNRVIRLLVK
ncbi:oligosaccharide flippase family protein [Pontiella sp.]|uniref:oligosaccharide flippase family protein n=1 Tax=Pontiella sp. TaxID=2837462 RepID=UPI003566292C